MEIKIERVFKDSINRYHRTDGPAVIWNDKAEEWWIHGNYIYYTEVRKWMREHEINGWPFTEEERILFELTFG